MFLPKPVSLPAFYIPGEKNSLLLLVQDKNLDITLTPLSQTTQPIHQQILLALASNHIQNLTSSHDLHHYIISHLDY